jgi:23S rRNA (uracil1939-C5)-methyltransferase
VTSTVTIEEIAAGGDGVGRLDEGLVVFVPRSAPGDELEIEITQRKQRYARGRVSAVLLPGPDRVEPSCTHYDSDECGGCQLQHMSADAQRAAKKKIVGDALRRIGKLNVPDPEVVSSPKQWRYRSKVTLAAKQNRIGFRSYGRPESVFDLGDCLLACDRIMELWKSVSANRAQLPSALKSLVLREDRCKGLHIVAVGGEEIWDAAPLAAALGVEQLSYWWQPEGGAARVVAGPRTGYPAVAFEQMNAELAETIRQTAVASLGNLDGKVVWDLYGGAGDTAEMLASMGAIVWSVDSDRSAVEWGSARAADAGVTGSRVNRVNDRVEAVVTRLPRPDLVVVNPPRAGLGSALVRWLQRWGDSAGGARVAYVSCDPATLARDLASLPAFGVELLMAYDLFPQTGHVETLTVLEAA